MLFLERVGYEVNCFVDWAGVERSVGYAGVGMGSGRGRGRPRGRRREDDYPHGPSNYGGRGGPSSDRSEMDSRGKDHLSASHV